MEGTPDDKANDLPGNDTVVKKPVNNNVVDILKRLQSSGALLKKPKQEHYCFTCKKDFSNWEELETHLITHVSLPSVVAYKLPSDDEDAPQSGEEDWSDEEDEAPPPTKTPPKTPQKIEISQLLKKTGLSLKKPIESLKSSDSALDKLSGLGFTIKKSSTPVKKEPEQEKDKASDVMQKLEKLGGLKLKIKCEGSNSNTFKVVNGLKDFKTESDEEDDKSDDENEKSAENPDGDSDEEQDKSGDQEPEESEPENDSEDEKKITSNKVVNDKIANVLKNLQGKKVEKVEAISPVKPAAINRTPSKDVPPAKPVGRPNMKQTPKRGANLPLPPKEGTKVLEIARPTSVLSNSAPERRQSHDINIETVVVKKEVETPESQSATNAPLFFGQIKTERSSPPLQDRVTPIIATVKTESEPLSTQNAQPLFFNQTKQNVITPLLPVTKTEETGVTIIEINGDSNDEDDDCCVVSATPASDIKPIIPKTEPENIIEQVNYPPPTTSTPCWVAVTSHSSYPITSSYGNSLPRSSSLQKNHSFNWNAPDSKPPIDMLEKSAEDIFESLLSNTPKKEGFSISDASEYISLDTLGPQHTCNVCNTRFTSISLLDDHRRMTGHSNSLVTPSSSTLLPYNPAGASTILQSLLPVKQMVEQVGKITGMGGAGFTHQQNVMINIQAYPGAGGVLPQQGGYNAYGQQQNMPPGYAQTQNSMYGGQQQMPGQYPNQPYGASMGGMPQQGFGQFQNSMPKPGYPGTSFDSSPFSTASPLQSMQQSVYGQPTTSMGSQLGQMGPPPAPHSNQYVPTSSPGMMKPPMTTSSGVRIQNIQTFPPGQMLGMQGHPDHMGAQPLAPGQVVGGQMPSPGQIRMASGANVNGPRNRMPNVRGQRPTIRPGIQVHGQIRGNKPGVRMPMKRPGMPGGPGGPAMKKRPTMLLPGKHDNEDCQVMALQKQREGMPMIQSVQGAKDKLNLGSQISITKKVVNKEASAMANILATRGISVKQKQKSRSPSPERPVPHIPNLGAGVSIKHTSRSSNFSIPEAKVGGGMLSCKICNKMFMNQNSLSAHMSTAHPSSKLPMFRCEECPAAYPKILQLQHHKRVFHNVVGPNRELGLPVVDMSQEDNLKRLSSLGIYSFIPLADKDGGGGCFGLPIISVHNAQNGMTKHLQALGAEGLLSLGPLKQLPNT